MNPRPVMQRFPLVARPRPHCPPLAERIASDVTHPARAASREADDSRCLTLAATAQNKAALIASDCGLPELARTWCWRHYDAYSHAHPLAEPAALHAVEPLVNLARLRLRAGDGTSAHQLLTTLYEAVRTSTGTEIDGCAVSFRHLTGTRQGHRKVCRKLWAVLLADGTRALASTGHWDQALAHAERHRGIGRRLLDGRQVAVIAHHACGDTHTARNLLAASDTPERWEQATAACLRVLCNEPDHQAAGDVDAMVTRYLALDTATETLVFRIRLGLAVVDLAHDASHPDTAHVAARIITETLVARDGHAAREVLASNRSAARITATEAHELSAAVKASGLGQRSIPTHLRAQLETAIETSEASITRALATLPRTSA